jgi:hypothetical protein
MSERVRHPQEVLVMSSLAAGISVAVAVPAGAVPAPEPATATVSACPVGMDGLAGRLGSIGLSAQPAHVTTELTYRDCLRNLSAG